MLLHLNLVIGAFSIESAVLRGRQAPTWEQQFIPYLNEARRFGVLFLFDRLA